MHLVNFFVILRWASGQGDGKWRSAKAFHNRNAETLEAFGATGSTSRPAQIVCLSLCNKLEETVGCILAYAVPLWQVFYSEFSESLQIGNSHRPKRMASAHTMDGIRSTTNAAKPVWVIHGYGRVLAGVSAAGATAQWGATPICSRCQRGAADIPDLLLRRCPP